MKWFLIILILGDYSDWAQKALESEQFGPFQTEKACKVVADQIFESVSSKLNAKKRDKRLFMFCVTDR